MEFIRPQFSAIGLFQTQYITATRNFCRLQTRELLRFLQVFRWRWQVVKIRARILSCLNSCKGFLIMQPKKIWCLKGHCFWVLAGFFAAMDDEQAKGYTLEKKKPQIWTCDSFRYELVIEGVPTSTIEVDVYIYMDVSENSGTPKSSILIGFSIINHPFWGTSILETPIYSIYKKWDKYIDKHIKTIPNPPMETNSIPSFSKASPLEEGAK